MLKKLQRARKKFLMILDVKVRKHGKLLIKKLNCLEFLFDNVKF